MTSFPGFAVSGYRSLSGDAQWIPLDPAVTVFLGGNNSGKSNVLRLLNLHMDTIFQSLINGRDLEGFDVRLDAPRASGDQGLKVNWPLDVSAMLGAEQAGTGIRDLIERLLALPGLNDHGVTALPFQSPSLQKPLAPVGPEPDESGFPTPRDWELLSGHYTSTRGGEEGANAKRTLFKLREWCIPPPKTVFVPPARALTGAASGDPADWNFGGAGMIQQLERLTAPTFDDDLARKRGEALTRDLRILLDDNGLRFDVPHDRATVNVFLSGQWFPLESLGTGTEHAILILAARHVYPDRLLCLEEPDAHLHPRLQRRLLQLLRAQEAQQIAIATHSAQMIDAASTVVAVRLEAARSSLERVGSHALFEALRLLGYRASDLLQTNCIVWVEGPSDRIYLLHWLKAVDSDLIEGIDFSIAFYGGALLARLSADEETDDPTLVDLWKINRRMWMVMDSDRGEGDLKPAVERLRDEIKGSGVGGTWITEGFTIENYVDPTVLKEAVKDVHPTVASLGRIASNANPLAKAARADRTRVKYLDKVAIALAVSERPADLDVLDLRDRITELAGFIRATPTRPIAEDVLVPHE